MNIRAAQDLLLTEREWELLAGRVDPVAPVHVVAVDRESGTVTLSSDAPAAASAPMVGIPR